MNNVFVYCEIDKTTVEDVSLELLTKGRKLANQLGVQLEAVCAGTGIKGKVERSKKEVRSKAEIDRRQLLAALALDEDEAITAAALSEIKAERPDTIINDSGLPDEQVRAIFGPLGIDF